MIQPREFVMFTDSTRREFLKSSAVVAASVPVSTSFAGFANALANTAGNASGLVSVDSDLLRAVGERIGFDAALRVAPNGEAVSLMYFDYAGTSVDALRVGIESGLSFQCGKHVASNEIELPYGDLLGVAIVKNLETAVETRIEIDATMLSHLALIEANAPSGGIAKSSVMSADAAYFYNVVEYA
jgi:hypothetical protein